MRDRQISIEGQKVRLRPFEPADITDAYLGWLTDPIVTRFSNQRFRSHDRGSAAAFLASFAGTDNLFLSIDRRADSAAIGTLTVYVSRHHGTADVGIMVGDRSAWGRGFGQDAWTSLVEWLLARPEIRKVTAGTLACNLPMIRLAERSRMVPDGRRRDQEIVDGSPFDILYFAHFSDD